MSSFHALVKFTSDTKTFFSPVKAGKDGKLEQPALGDIVIAYDSVDDLQAETNPSKQKIEKFLAPLPSTTVPIYCVGLNYRSHAEEANLTVPKYPPLWTQPATSLADPDEDIPVNQFCATSLLDFEGELVFVTSKDCKNVFVEQASDYTLGYKVSTDLSCRLFQTARLR